MLPYTSILYKSHLRKINKQTNLLFGTSHNWISSSSGALLPTMALVMFTKEPSMLLSNVFMRSSNSLYTRRSILYHIFVINFTHDVFLSFYKMKQANVTLKDLTTLLVTSDFSQWMITTSKLIIQGAIWYFSWTFKYQRSYEYRQVNMWNLFILIYIINDRRWISAKIRIAATPMRVPS